VVCDHWSLVEWSKGRMRIPTEQRCAMLRLRAPDLLDQAPWLRDRGLSSKRAGCEGAKTNARWVFEVR
jgi:hypothetical protein